MAQKHDCPNCGEAIPGASRYCQNCGLPVGAGDYRIPQDYNPERFFEHALDLCCIAGVDGYFKRVNAAFRRVLGWNDDELLGKPFVEFIHPEDRTETLREVGKLAEGSPTLAFENRYRCKDGSYRDLFWTSFPDPDTGLLYAIARDVTELRKLQDRMWNPLRADLVTGIANRQAFHEALEMEWKRGTRTNAALGVLVIDIDHFGEFNAQFGFEAGDEFLRSVAAVISTGTRRAGDVAARFGGKRFSMLLSGRMSVDDVRGIAERIHREIPAIRPEASVTVSIGGVVVEPSAEGAPAVVIGLAETALAEAKRLGGDQVVVRSE